MFAGTLLLLFAVAVRTDQAPLRAGCDESDEIVAKMPSGTAVEIRFAMSGSKETCYKVAATVGGKAVQGYVGASALSGLEAFEQARNAAPVITTPGGPAPSVPAAPKSDMNVTVPAGHPLMRAAALLRGKQPRAALDLVEKSLELNGRDQPSLLLAAVAAYQSDDLKRALDYLKEAQQIGGNPEIDEMLVRLQKEMAGDRSGDKLYGTRFLLRYEGGNLPSDTARSMVAMLEEEYSKVSAQLGCRMEERLVTIVQSRQAYFASTGAAEWSGGQFDGKIRVPLADRGSTPEIRKTFTHELVHACLSHMGNVPAWLHEGMAQKLSGERIPPSVRSLLVGAVKAGKMPKLQDMGQTFSRLSTQNAVLAYAYALLAVDTLFERFQSYGIHNILRNPERLPQITMELDKALGNGA